MAGPSWSDGKLSAAEQRPPRLTSLLYTDPAPYLPLPRVQPSGSGLVFSCAADQRLVLQDIYVDQAAQLLLGVDLSHIEARPECNLSVPCSSPAVGSVHAQLLARHPELFNHGASVSATGVSLLQQHEQQLIPVVSPLAASTHHALPPKPPSPLSSPPAPDQAAAQVPGVIATKGQRSVRQRRKAVPTQISCKDAAGACTAAIMRWLSESAAEIIDANGKDANGKDVSGMRHVRDVADCVRRARAASALGAVDPALLRRALGALGHAMRFAEVQVLAADDARDDHDGKDGAALAAEAGVDAAIAVLHIASESSLPRHLVAEETLHQVATLLRMQLQQNVLPFFSARLQRLLRPSLSDVGTAYMASGNKRAKVMKVQTSNISVPDGARQVLRRLEAALGVLPSMVAVGGRIPSDPLIRLLKMLSHCLTVSNLDVLHVQAAGVFAAVFCHMPHHRSLILEELVGTVMPNLPVSKALSHPRAARAGDCPDIHIVSQIFLQLMQGSVRLPAAGASAKTLQGCFTPAVVAADRFWTLQLDRLATSDGVGKSERDADTKMWIERTVADVLAVLNCLEWPAAPLAINRLINLLRTKPTFGLGSPNLGIRQMYVDLLGTVTTKLHGDSDASEVDQPWIRSLLNGFGTGASGEEDTQSCPGASDSNASCHVRQLMLQNLCLSAQSGHAAAQSAIDFVVAESVSEQARVLLSRGSAAREEEAAILAHSCQEVSRVMHSHIADLGPGDAMRLGRFIVQHSALGRIRASSLRWLQECVDPLNQAAIIRCKAVKALRSVVQASPRLLSQPAVMEALSLAFEDSSKVVREAAIELLGRHVGEKAALDYFDHFVAATRDPGIGVRKRALQIIWESFIRRQDFERTTDACVAVLRCSADSEESIRQLVARVFQDLWFSPGMGQLAGSAATRAAQLARVAAACYGSFDNIQLPMDANNPLVTVLASAMQDDMVKKSHGGEGPRLAAALLEAFLAAQEVPSDDASHPDSSLAVAPLLALHALSLADVSVCLPPEDPSLFVRSLAPNLKTEGNDQSSPLTLCLLAILAILSTMLPQLEHLNREVTKEMSRDLWSLVAQQLRTQVPAAACEVFAHLARLSPEVARPPLVQLATKYVTMLAGHTPALDDGFLRCWSDTAVSPEALAAARANAPRALFVVGRLWRFGCDSLQHAATAAEADEAEGSPPPAVSLQRCLDVIFAFCQLPVSEDALQDAALQALGQLFIARPGLMLLERSVAITTSALSPTASLALKHRMLRNLTELLKAEQERQGHDPTSNAAALQLPKDAAGSDVDHESAAAIAAHNGEGDSVGVRSGVLQANWESILRLATEVGTHADLQSRAALVRRRAFEVIEAVCRAGLVPPWKPVPALVVLSTDSQPDVARAALQLLARQSTLPGCTAGEFQTFMATGVPLAHEFHVRLAEVSTPDSNGSKVGTAVPAAALVSGVAAIYARFVQPTRGAPATFLSALLRRFDSAATVCPPRAALIDLRLMSTCAQLITALPFRHADEPLAALTSISAIIARRGDAALNTLRVAVEHHPGSTGAETSPLSAAAAASDGGSKHSGNTESSPAASTPHTNGTPQGGLYQNGVSHHQLPAGLEASCRAALVVSMLLMLKRYLLDAYTLAPQRIALYATGNAEKHRMEEKTAVACARGTVHHLDELRLDCATDLGLATQQFKILRYQMKEDAASYIGSLTASDEDTPGLQSRRGALTAVKGGPGTGGTRRKRQAVTTGGKVRVQRTAALQQVDSQQSNGEALQPPTVIPQSLTAPRRLEL